jgi:hypothetical protein
MLSVTNKPQMLSVIMLDVIMLNVVMVNVVAPLFGLTFGDKDKKRFYNIDTRT